MGLKSVIQNAVNTAFSAVGDLAEVVTINYKSSDRAYNATTGALADTPTTHAVAKAVFSKYRFHEIDNRTIFAKDRRCSFPVTLLSVTPRPNTDTLTDSSGTLWQIIDARMDPAKAMWVLQLRS